MVTREQLLAEVNAAIERSPVCDVRCCSRPRFSRGLCASHAQQVRRYGRVVYEKLNEWSRERSVCICPHCDGVALSRKMCAAHYQKWLRTGQEPATMAPIKRRTKR